MRWFLALISLAAAAGVGRAAPTVAFDLPEGDTATSLRRFATQAGVQVIFLEDALDGTRAAAVTGEFTPSEALDRLLAGTGLKATRDEHSGAFAVSRGRLKATKPVPESRPVPPPVKRGVANESDGEGRPITLTPFEVSTARDRGFVAAQSLAGGRLAADLRDTPAAYSVMTRELMDALDVVDLTEANEWMVNATSNDDRGSGELIGGVAMINSRGVSANDPSRNFFLLPVNFDRYNLERFDFSRGPNAILFGESTFGGTPNVITKSARPDRSFGRASVTFSSWNSIRGTVDVNERLRGHAALRINALLQDSRGFRTFEGDRKKAITLDLVWRPFRDTEVRLEGERAVLDRRKPMTPLYDLMTGWDGRTTFSALQTGPIPQANAKGVSKYGSSTAPYFLFSPGLGMTTVGNFANTVRTIGGGSSPDVPVGGIRYAGNTSPHYHQHPLNEALNVPAGLLDVVQANSSFRLPGRDFAVSTNDPTMAQSYATRSLFVRQRIGGNLFLEVAGNVANEDRINNYMNYRGMNNIAIDVNSRLPDGAANPRFLEAFSDSSRSRLRLGNEYRNLRAAVAYTLQETRAGDFTFSACGGLSPSRSYQYIEGLRVAPDPSDLRSAYANGVNANVVFYRYYLDERNRPLPTPASAVFGLNDGSAVPPQSLPVRWLGDASRETDQSITRRRQRYLQAAIKGVLLQHRLHLLVAARADKLTINRRVNLGFARYPADWDGTRYFFRPDAPADYDELTYFIRDPAGEVINPVPQEALTRPTGAQYANDRFKNDYNPKDIHSSAKTFSAGGVLHLNRWLSLFGNQATSFLPTSNFRDVSGEFIPGPTSQGYDAGVRLSFLDGRIYVSAGRYAGHETAQVQEASVETRHLRTIAQANREGDYGPGNNQRNLPEPSTQTADTRDRKNRGYEFELTANFASSWRCMLNAALPRGWQFNNKPILAEYLRRNDGVIRLVLADAGVEIDASHTARVRSGIDPNNLAESQSAANAWNELVRYKQELIAGEQLIDRLVNYTVNLSADYLFESGWLRRVRLGGGIQLRGREIIGYRGSDTMVDPANPGTAIDDPTVDAYTPIYTPGYHLVSARIGYTIKLQKQRTLEFQLNIGNVLNDTRPHYVNATTRPPNGNLGNPSRVSTPNEFYYLPPRNFRFTTTLGF